MPLTWRGADDQSNWGSGIIISGQTTVTISHGLTEQPDVVLITAKLLGSAASLRVSSRTKTQFVVTANADPGATTATFDWLAACGPRTAF